MSRRWVAAGAALVLVAATVWFGWWMRNPEPPRWGGYGLEIDRTVMGRTVWMPIYATTPGATEPRSVTLVSLEPVFERGSSSDVEVDYMLCEVDPVVARAEGVDGTGYGGRDRDTERMCTTLEPAAGADLDLSRPFLEFIVGVTPLTTNPVLIDGHRIQFTDGARTAYDLAEVGLRLTASPRPKG